VEEIAPQAGFARNGEEQANVAMKIVQVTGFFWPEKYGSNELFLCREFARRGHEVTVFTASKPLNEYANIGEGRSWRRKEFFEGFAIERFPSFPNLGNVAFMPTMLSALLKRKFDLIHAHECFAPSSFYSAVAASVKNTPFLITQHNDQLPRSYVKRILYCTDTSTSGKYVLMQAKKIVALSRSIKKHLLMLRAKEEKIEVIPNAIDTVEFAPDKMNLLKENWGISPPVVLFVGRLIEKKGIRYLLEAFLNVIEELPDVKLVLVGGGPEEKRLLEAQRKCANIYHIDFVDNKLMPNIYSGSDVVVMPSLEERFGNVVLEAMASGKPVIGSFVGGMKDTIVHGKTGYHVQPMDSERISHSILKILTDQNLRKRLGQNAREFVVQNYSTQIVADRIEKLYDDAVSPK
jgi:glycosyltransferase involved in cell wall biosynthesis